MRDLASRWRRLGGVLIDAGLMIPIMFPYMGYLNFWDYAKENGEVPIEIAINIAVAGWVLFFVFNTYLLNKYGQTVGKKILGTYIVSLEGNKPNFWPLVSRRYIIIGLIYYIPVIGSFVALINGLFIFRKDKRCIHDLIAGTVVIDNDRHLRPPPKPY
jgi:uncharacterized RDD family membrane protein YckC